MRASGTTGSFGRFVLLAMLMLWAPSAWAEATASIEARVGNHPGFGRLVFEFAAREPYRQVRTGNDLSLHFATDVVVAPPAHPPHNVDTVTAQPGEIDLAVQTGATTHVFWIGNRLVVDVMDPAASGTAQAPQTVAPTAAATTASAMPGGATQEAVTQATATRAPMLSPAPGAALTASSGSPAVVSPTEELPTRETAPRGPKRAASASLPLPPPPAPPIPPAAPTPAAAPSTATGPHASRTVGPAAQGVAASPTPPIALAPSPSLPTPLSPSPVVPAGMPSDARAGHIADTPGQATAPVQAAIPATIQAPVQAPAHPVAQSAAQMPAPPLTLALARQPGLAPTLAAATADPTAAPLDTTPLATPLAIPLAAAGTPVGPVEPLAGPADTPQPVGMVLALPFPTGVGVAAFRRGDSALVVFDQRQAIDLAAVRSDPVLGTATVKLLPDATVLHLRLPADHYLTISRGRQGWSLGVVAAAPSARPIGMRSAEGALTLPADAVGEVVAIVDPETGATLLVGTQRATGQNFPTLRQTPEFSLLPTWQGVVVEPLADNLAMRAGNDAFVITGGSKGLPLAPTSTATQAQADAAGMTRRFDLHAQPLPALVERLRREVLAAAAAPALARGPLRERAAETMIALGLGPEAQAMLHLAADDDPGLAASADMTGLGAIAALLAHRTGEADGIEDPRLSGSDEVMLWRAVRTAARTPGSPLAAAGFATTAPLIAIYPAALRQRLLPLAAETMIKGGQKTAAARLLARQPDDPTLALARGMLRQADGDTDGALAIYDRLANDPDRLVHDRAAVHAVELRLSAGRIDAAHAADTLDHLLYAWRGGHRELALREWIAALREYSGNWTAALAMLHETESLFPDAAQAVHARLRAAFLRLLQDKALDRLAPLELVSLVDENADLLPSGTVGEALEERLADRLLALDLPNRAAPVLAKLMAAAPSPAGRAGFGARLAALRLREDDAKGALAALAASEPAIAEAPAAATSAPASGLATGSAPGAATTPETGSVSATTAASPALAGTPAETAPPPAASAAAAAPGASPGPPSLPSSLPSSLPGPLVERRTLIMAAAQARLGDTAHAVAELTALGTAAADLARAAILEQAKDWPNAEHALADYVSKAVPPTGTLDAAQQQILVRYATAAAQAGDEATLNRLRTDDGPRMPAGAFGDMFRLLTAAPVQVSADLPRAIRETALAHALPKSLDALNPPTGSP